VRVVLDTNVIVSAFLKPQSKPARILRLILQGEVRIIINEPILSEYYQVLSRPKFGLDRRDIQFFLDFFRAKGTVAPAVPELFHLPDPDDEIFLEAALGAKADVLITGNKKHFPKGLTKGLRILNPDEFLSNLSGS